jgi:hypothetical protein
MTLIWQQLSLIGYLREAVRYQFLVVVPLLPPGLLAIYLAAIIYEEINSLLIYVVGNGTELDAVVSIVADVVVVAVVFVVVLITTTDFAVLVLSVVQIAKVVDAY